MSASTARDAIAWSWRFATRVSVVASVLWFFAVWTGWEAVWGCLSGLVFAFVVAAMYDRRNVLGPNRRYWWIFIPAVTHMIWAMLFAAAIDGPLRELGIRIDPLILSTSITGAVFAVAFRLAERSSLPFFVLAAATGLVVTPECLGADVNYLLASVAVPAMFTVLTMTAALLNHRHLKSRIRRPGRCVKCQYLAVDLPKCPECGGPIAPLDGPVVLDPRLDS